MTPSKKYTLNEKTVQLLNDTSDKKIDVFFLSKLEYFKGELPSSFHFTTLSHSLMRVTTSPSPALSPTRMLLLQMSSIPKAIRSAFRKVISS